MKYAAIFIDEENIYRWVKDNYESKYSYQSPELEFLSKVPVKKTGLEFHKYFDISKLWEYLDERGIKISRAVCFVAGSGLNQHVVRRLYEWGVKVIPAIRYEYKCGESREFKSLLDAMMIVEILATAYENKHVETFVIISGDKDFYPVAMKLRELGKEVIIVGPDEDTADILKTNFEFIDVAMFVKSETLVNKEQMSPKPMPPKTKPTKSETDRIPVSGEKVQNAIIKVLGDLGGQAPVKEVLRRVKMMIEEFNTPFWLDRDNRGSIRWKHRIHTEKARLKQEGIIKEPEESGRGIWELTEKGWEYYEILKQ